MKQTAPLKTETINSKPLNKTKIIYGLLIATLVMVCISVILNAIPLSSSGETYAFFIAPMATSLVYCVLVIVASAFILKMKPNHKLKVLTILAIVFSLIGAILSNMDSIIFIGSKIGVFKPDLVIAFGLVMFGVCLAVGDLITLVFVTIQFVFFKKNYPVNKPKKTS
ncbi:MAG: hypothetical protein LBS76_00555 [Mycoplasmataceae bacterium]|jgi:hypothetical protein|nr:hypothetical protein [Mycoplasmataceae bacterium]